jgi:ThiF family
MKRSLRAWRLSLRHSHLAREEELYLGLDSAFQKVKDWDDTGSLVVWEGVLRHPDLSKPYKIKIHYLDEYPFVRPEVYPVDPAIRNQRHQNPSPRKDKTPGSLCLFPHTPDLWGVGLNCQVILERVAKWLRAYETQTLDQEFAPPEIERFFPFGQRLQKPAVLLIESLLSSFKAREGKCRLIPTVSGAFALLVLDAEADKPAHRNQYQSVLSLMLPNEKLDFDRDSLGQWFALDREPWPVPLNLADLLRLLKNSGRQLKKLSALARDKAKVVALTYPVSAANHWLVFGANFILPSRNRGGFREKTLHYKILESNASNSVWLYPTHDVSKETLFRRVSGFQVEVLAAKRCTILGCGSIGSRIAESLIKTGVGQITLIDKDTIRVGNVARHVLSLDSLGRNKAEALRDHLLRKNPFAEVHLLTENPLSQPNKFEQLVADSDLVISCIGSDAAELYVNAACLRQKKPVAFCRSHLEGRLGVVLLSAPPTYQACFGCASTYLSSSECPIPKIPTVPYEKLVGLDPDCGSAYLPASAIDLDLISLHAARMSLQLLQGKKIDGAYWLIRGREFDFDEYPELNGEIRQPFSLSSYEIPSSINCEICRIK